MKFLKITSKHTFDNIDKLSEVNLSKFELELAEELKKLYSFEYIYTLDTFGMIATINNNYIDKLVNILTKIDKDILIEDLTNDVLFGNFNANELIKDGEYSLINYYTEEFIKDNLTIDIVLDKILEFGKDSLNNNDLRLLNNQI